MSETSFPNFSFSFFCRTSCMCFTSRILPPSVSYKSSIFQSKWKYAERRRRPSQFELRRITHHSFIRCEEKFHSFSTFAVLIPEADRIYEKRRRYDEYVVEKKHSAQLLGNKLKDLNCSNRAEEAKEIVKPGLLIIPPDDIVFVALVQCPKSMQCSSETWRIKTFAFRKICSSWICHNFEGLFFSKLIGVFRF